MKRPVNHCPICGIELLSQRIGEMDVWLCAEEHGTAMTLSEAYEHAQEDELRLLWQIAVGRRPDVGAPRPSGRRCPGDGIPMVTVDLPYDDDELDEGADGDGPNLGTVTLDVCTTCQFVWFDSDELQQLPADLPDPELTEVQQRELDRIVANFGASIDAAHERRDHDDLATRFADRVGSRSGLQRALSRATVWSARDDSALERR